MAKRTKKNEANEKAPKPTKAAQLAKYKAGYEPYVTATGTSLDNGDDVALALRGASIEVVMRAAEKLKGMEPGELATRYADRNPGAKRMNSGNIIRGCVRRGDVTPAAVIKTLKAASKEVNAVA